jgi:hypothetical protein
MKRILYTHQEISYVPAVWQYCKMVCYSMNILLHMVRLENFFCFIAYADLAPDAQPHLLLRDTKQQGCFSPYL